MICLILFWYSNLWFWISWCSLCQWQCYFCWLQCFNVTAVGVKLNCCSQSLAPTPAPTDGSGLGSDSRQSWALPACLGAGAGTGAVCVVCVSKPTFMVHWWDRVLVSCVCQVVNVAPDIYTRLLFNWFQFHIFSLSNMVCLGFIKHLKRHSLQFLVFSCLPYFSITNVCLFIHQFIINQNPSNSLESIIPPYHRR